MIGLGDLTVHERPGREGCGTRQSQGGRPGPVKLA